jgi:hypothetical protein
MMVRVYHHPVVISPLERKEILSLGKHYNIKQTKGMKKLSMTLKKKESIEKRFKS